MNSLPILPVLLLGCDISDIPENPETSKRLDALEAANEEQSALIASGGTSTISGGSSNTTTGGLSAVSGGYGNAAQGTYSSVVGGYANTASSNYSVTP